MFKIFLLVPICILTSALTVADHHEEVDARAEGADDLRAEYQFCSLKEGKTLKDVEKEAQKYGDYAAANGVKYNQSLLTPIHAGSSMGEYSHVIVGHWPNGREMYKDWGVYLNEFPKSNRKSSQTCSASYATFQLRVVQAMDDSMDTDVNRPVQYADCKLNDGKTLDDAVTAEKAVAELVASVGLTGYGVNYILPYLGQTPSDHDFTSLVYFQNFMARGEMAFNYYKVAAEAEAITSEVYSCINSRSFAVKSLFTNWGN
jgi:hypothetical protein